MSAYVVSNQHINRLLKAGMSGAPHRGELRWMAPEDPNPEDYQRGAVSGPTALETFRRRARTLTKDTADAVGHMLLVENHRSVNHRYDEAEEPEAFFAYTREAHYPDPVHVLKLISCYVYQSCEHPGWEGSEAKAFIDALTKRMIDQLPGYEDAPWGI